MNLSHKCIARWLLLPLAFFSSSLFAQQQEESTWVITNLEPPFIKKDRGEITGYAAEVVRSILLEAGVNSPILNTRWERLEKEARTKANVIAFALARTREREDSYHWITPLTSNMFGVYAHKAVPVNSLADLSQFESVIVLKGDAREKILLEAGLKNVLTFDYWPDGVEYFTQNSNTAIFFSDAGMRIYCKSISADCSSTTRIFGYDKRQSYLVVSKPGTDLRLVHKLKKASERFKASEEFQQMAEHWLNEYSKTTDIPMHLDQGVVNLWIK